MPQLIFKACTKEDVRAFSRELPKKLAQIDQTPEDYFTFEWPGAVYYQNGEETALYPIVEIQQFARDKNVQRKMAETIAEAVLGRGYDCCDIYFIPLDVPDYHEFVRSRD